jgi:hypothetical protein
MLLWWHHLSRRCLPRYLVGYRWSVVCDRIGLNIVCVATCVRVGESAVFSLLDDKAAYLPANHVRLLADATLAPTAVLDEIASLACTALRHPQRTLIVVISGIVGVYPDEVGTTENKVGFCYII